MAQRPLFLGPDRLGLLHLFLVVKTRAGPFRRGGGVVRQVPFVLGLSGLGGWRALVFGKGGALAPRGTGRVVAASVWSLLF